MSTNYAQGNDAVRQLNSLLRGEISAADGNCDVQTSALHRA